MLGYGYTDPARRAATLLRVLAGAVLVLGLIGVGVIASDIASADSFLDEPGDPTAAWSFAVGAGFSVATPAAVLYGLSWVIEALADVRDELRSPGKTREGDEVGGEEPDASGGWG